MGEDEKNQEPLRVLVSAPLGVGGITSLMMSIQNGLDHDEMNFDYIVWHDRKEPMDDAVAAMGSRKLVASADWMPLKPLRGFLRIFEIAKVCRENKVKILHLNSGSPISIIKVIAARMGGVKYITMHSHNGSAVSNSMLDKAANALCRPLIPLVCDDLWACSSLAAQFTFPKRIAAEKKFYFMPNGIDLKKFSYDPALRDSIRKELGWEKHFVVGHAGRFNYQKNHAFLIDIFAEIAKKDDTAILALFGVGELQDTIRKKVRNLGLESRVRFYGASDRMEQMYQGMDVFLMPSRFEGLPVSGVEAQAAGLPIVFADTITREVAVSDQVQYISLKESPAVWAKKVLATKDLSRRDWCRELYAAGFDRDGMIEHFKNYYLNVGKKLGII